MVYYYYLVKIDNLISVSVIAITNLVISSYRLNLFYTFILFMVMQAVFVLGS